MSGKTACCTTGPHSPAGGKRTPAWRIGVHERMRLPVVPQGFIARGPVLPGASRYFPDKVKFPVRRPDDPAVPPRIMGIALHT